MADDSLKQRMEELRRTGLTEQQIIDLVSREIQRTIAEQRTPSDGSETRSIAPSLKPHRHLSTEGRELSETGAISRAEPTEAIPQYEPDAVEAEEDATPEVQLLSGGPNQAPVRQVLALLQQRQSMTFSGPLPPPEWAEQYERLLPGFLDRQVQLQERKAGLAERDTALAERIVESQDNVKKRGQWLASTVALGFLILAAYIGASNPWAGATVAMLDVSALTAAFVFGRQVRTRRRALPEAGNGATEDDEDGDDDDFE